MSVLSSPRQWVRQVVYNQERPGDCADVLRQFRHWRNWITHGDYRRAYREIARLTALPRYVPTTTSLLGTPFELLDAYSFLGMYREIFQQEIYRFRTNNPEPFIIDAGANIGVSTLYFKTKHPTSTVVAFEAAPDVFRLLEANIRRAALSGVQLVERALWSSETTLRFLPEGSDGGRIASAGDEREKRYNTFRFKEWTPGPIVQTTRLRPYLDRPVDFLKLDIEGAETEVLRDCADLLRNVDNLFLEYHSFASEEQTLHEVLAILRDAGFRTQIQQVTPTSPRPFMTRYLRWGMDVQLNIFCMRTFRDEHEHAVIMREFPRHEVPVAP